MATKSQHASAYLPLPPFLRTLREEAGLTQRDLGKRMKRPQSWIYNCESANRRVDLTEFIDWAKCCGVNAVEAFSRFLERAYRAPRT
jgi:transcriptional regulator with XRE-family HTH domain